MMAMRAAAASSAAPCIASAGAAHHSYPMLPHLGRPAARQTRTHLRTTRLAASEGTAAPAGPSDLAATPAATSTDTALVPSREGYRSFVMQGCEFLVRQTPDGALCLAETFVVDDAGASTRAALVPAGGDIPAEPQFFHPAEVAINYPGNIFEGKEARSTVLRVYLTAIQSIEPLRLDLQTVYLLDSAKRSVERLVVQRLAPLDTPEHELRVRIRDRWVVVDSAASLPTPEAVVQAAMVGAAAMSKLEAEAAERGEPVGPAAPGEASAAAAAPADNVVAESTAAEGEDGDEDVLYDDDLLKDFLVEINDDDADESEFDGDYDMPDGDY